jgi:hypothetical protein
VGFIRAIRALFSPVSESRFPETETEVAETGSIERLLSGETEDLALARPFGREVEQPGDPYAMRERAFDGRFDKFGCQECERDRFVDFARATSLSFCDAFCRGGSIRC